MTETPWPIRLAWPFSIACPVNQVIPTPEVPSIPGESLIIVPAEPPVLYASDPEAGQAFRSLDRGRSWSPVPGWTELLPRDPYGSRSPAVLVHPAVPARVFQLAGGVLPQGGHEDERQT